jgi:hypothetical protein
MPFSSFLPKRRVVFVTGEPGIGKSTLVTYFLNCVPPSGKLCILRGQCIEQFGAQEAYYPVFDALSRAAREAVIPEFLTVLRTYAPTWLMELPGVVSVQDREILKQETLGASRERMLREMTEAIEILATETPLVMVLEDLHWSDVSTLDLISSIANRTESARLMLIATYRPVEAILADHPVKTLKQGLLERGACSEIELESLDENAVRELLDWRFPKHRFPADFAPLVHSHTEGNPLFVTNVLDYAVSREAIVPREGGWELASAEGDFDLRVPEGLTRIIERQIARLTAEEQSALEVASVIGATFAIPVMPGFGVPEIDSLEVYCEGLVKRNLFIRAAGVSELAPGNIGARYQFIHGLYRDAFYKRLSPARRIRLHRTVGNWLETLYQDRLNEVAPELALHFQESHDVERAIRYLRLVAQKCASRHALREALEALTRAAALARRMPQPARSAAEFALSEQIGLVHRLMGQLRSSANEFDKMYAEARAASSVEGQLRALLWFASVTSWLDRTRCLEAVDRIKALCDARPPHEWRVNAIGQVAYWNLLFRGWDEADFAASAAALEAARRNGDRPALALQANRHSYFLSLASKYREASEMAAEGVRLSIEIESLMDYSVGHFFEAFALFHQGEWGRMKKLLRSAIDMARRNCHDFWVLLFGLLEALLHIETFAFDQACHSCREYVERARELGHPLSVQMSLVFLGRAQLGLGDFDAARRTFTEIREWQSRERILMDWIWRLPLQFGYVELLLAQKDLAAALGASDVYLEQTAATAERTWTGLAHYARARVAAAQNDEVSRQRHIATGLDLIRDCHAPIAAWRLHAVAGDFEKSGKILLELAQSLASEPDLSSSFSTAGEVAALLGRGKPATA